MADTQEYEIGIGARGVVTVTVNGAPVPFEWVDVFTIRVKTDEPLERVGISVAWTDD